jgi:hypothetical protein
MEVRVRNNYIIELGVGGFAILERLFKGGPLLVPEK